MSDLRQSRLKLNPHIASAPLYVAGTSIEDVLLEYNLDKVIKLASNESPLGASPKALAAIEGALTDLQRYPPVTAQSLHDALAAHSEPGLTADHFVTANGASELIDMLARSFVGEGDNAIICCPTFPLYEISTRRCGGQVRYVDLDASFTYDVDAILNAIDDRTRIIFLCTPNNPTGTLLTPQQANRLVAEAPEQVLLVFDESYRLFVSDKHDLVDTVDLILNHPNVVSLRSFSKSFGLASLRIGYTIASPLVAAYISRLCHPFHTNNLALCGAIAALDDHEYLRRLRQLILKERTWLTSQLQEQNLEVIVSQANFISVRAAFPSQLIYERLLSEGIIVRPLDLFYLPEWFRVTIGKHEDNVRFIEALKRVLQAMNEEDVPTEVETGEDSIIV